MGGSEDVSRRPLSDLNDGVHEPLSGVEATGTIAPKVLVPPNFSGEGLQTLALPGRYRFLLMINQFGLVETVVLQGFESDRPLNQDLLKAIEQRIMEARFIPGRKGDLPVRAGLSFTVEVAED